MTFLTPLMLLGAAAVSVPVILHFFFRSRYRTVPWAAMNFLLTSIEQTSRRLKFQELLLLLARMALLALLALALARPVSLAFSVAAGGEAVDAVFLFDVSYSMAAREGTATRLDRAKAAALAVLDRLPAYSTVQIVTFADQAQDLGPRVPANLDQARDIIQNLETTHLSTDLLPGVKKAKEVLDSRQLPAKELYIFSDMQKGGWERQSTAVKEMLRDIGERAAVYLVRCGGRSVPNAAVTGIVPQSGIPRPDERVGFAVLVKNTGDALLRDLRVALLLDGDEKSADTQSIASLPPGETRAVTLTAKMTSAGLHVVTAVLKQDDLDADNRFDQVIRARDAVRVLVIDGAVNREEPARSSTFFLLHALQPVDETQRRQYHVQPTVVTPRDALPGLLDRYDLCVLSNVALKPDLKQRVPHLSPEFLRDLERFVRQGRGLLVFGGGNFTADDYNQLLVRQHRLLPYEIKGLIDRPVDDPLHLNRSTAALPVYRRFREDKVYEHFNNIMVWKAHELNEPVPEPARKVAPPEKAKEAALASGRTQNPVTVALRYGDGRAAVVAHRVDAGEVVFFNTSADPGWDPATLTPTWNTLALMPYWTPLIDVTLTHLLHRQDQSHNTTAGSTLTWLTPESEAGHTFALYQPDGKKVRLGTPRSDGGRAVITLTNLTRAGVYRLVGTPPDRQGADLANDPVLVEELRRGTAKLGRPFAVNPDLSESADLSVLSEAQIDAQLGFPVIHVTAGTDTTAGSGLDRSLREWTWWLLLLVLFVTAGEGVLAWFCGRPM